MHSLYGKPFGDELEYYLNFKLSMLLCMSGVYINQHITTKTVDCVSVHVCV